MDIFKYIESKDIREYLQSLDYQFTAAQAVDIVNKCLHLTLADKLNAYQEIIDTMPDCKLLGKGSEIGPISAHDFLREYIAVQRKLTDMYLRTEANTGYWLLGYWTEPDFTRAIAAWSAVGLLRYPSLIYKVWNGTGKRLCAKVNEEGEILVFLSLSDGIFTGEKREEAIFYSIYSIRNADLPLTKLYKSGDILQCIDNDLDGFIVTNVTKDGLVNGCLYEILEVNHHEIDVYFSFIGKAEYPIMHFERCSEEKAEKIRRNFKVWFTKLQDMYKEWEWE